MSEHTILVAFTVEDGTPEAAQITLMNNLPKPGQVITSWWIAEDDRLDRSDNDSAVFVPMGTQARASQRLNTLGLTPDHNVVTR